jgi:hypothetical protein
LRTKDTLDPRPLVFLAVLMLHAAIVLLLIRPARLSTNSGTSDEPLMLMLLHSPPPPPAGVATPRPAQTSKSRPARRESEPAPAIAPDNAITLPPAAQPPSAVDWQHEAELAAQDAVADAEREGNLRDLSSLTPRQLDWIKRNHMEPAPPGILWQHPRVEFIDRGVPIPVIRINDRCVLIIPLVFCGIGHIEASGDLFNHMRDPH